ncbi:hypothetical protein FGB62_164g05 [Gracilaria domingensis]|nr:hypothetical protein FGB62_164g05 [Gracilaria domingensis]
MGDYWLCDFTLDGVDPVYDHVRWGTGNYTLNGHVSGAFTPKIVKKFDDHGTTIGYVKSVDTLRDVFHCEAEANGPNWRTKCNYLTIPGSLFSTANIPGSRATGISRAPGAAMSPGHHGLPTASSGGGEDDRSTSSYI